MLIKNIKKYGNQIKQNILTKFLKLKLIFNIFEKNLPINELIKIYDKQEKNEKTNDKYKINKICCITFSLDILPRINNA